MTSLGLGPQEGPRLSVVVADDRAIQPPSCIMVNLASGRGTREDIKRRGGKLEGPKSVNPSERPVHGDPSNLPPKAARMGVKEGGQAAG